MSRLARLAGIRAVQRVADKPGLIPIWTPESAVSAARLEGAAWKVVALIDGAAVMRLAPDEDVDIMRAALVLRDVHRELGREHALIAEETAYDGSEPVDVEAVPW